MPKNPELELALQFIDKTDRNLFITGKAGTGKTTFLHQIKKESLKRMVIVAPTGVAAINAKGVTIHSFFKCLLGPFYPIRLQTHPTNNGSFQKRKSIL
jgi:Cdc6-like AAA superfamily ATPase